MWEIELGLPYKIVWSAEETNLLQKCKHATDKTQRGSSVEMRQDQRADIDISGGEIPRLCQKDYV